VPVAPPEILKKLEGKADYIVCLSSPINFYVVGQLYADFPQVIDEEVIASLAESNRPLKD